MNDRQKVKEAMVPGLTPASRLGCSIVFPTWLSVSDWTDGDSNSSASTEDISNMSWASVKKRAQEIGTADVYMCIRSDQQ